MGSTIQEPPVASWHINVEFGQCSIVRRYSDKSDAIPVVTCLQQRKGDEICSLRIRNRLLVHFATIHIFRDKILGHWIHNFLLSGTQPCLQVNDLVIAGFPQQEHDIFVREERYVNGRKRKGVGIVESLCAILVWDW